MQKPTSHRNPESASKDIATSSYAFVETIEHRRFIEFCDACRHFRYIGLCYGPPGIGKTLSAVRYSRADQIVPRDRWTSDVYDDRPVDTMLYTTSVVNTPSRVENDIRWARERVMSIVLDPIRREATMVLDEIRLKDEKRRREIMDKPGCSPCDRPAVDPTYFETYKHYKEYILPTTMSLVVGNLCYRQFCGNCRKIGRCYRNGGAEDAGCRAQKLRLAAPGAFQGRESSSIRGIVADLTTLPSGYPALLEELKSRIQNAQVRAAFAVSRELVLLYWSIGRDILARQGVEGWGAKVIDRLAHDLQVEFPGVEGFSPRNLKYMRTLAEAWPDPQIVPQLVALLPWGHLRVLLDKVDDPKMREWYLRAAVEFGWSRNVLTLQIESELHKREGKAITNFQRALPPPGSDLAEQILKDPYNFDFLTVTSAAKEREIERGLLIHLRDLLLELGRGFAFMGSQVPLDVAGERFYIDLLFYHVRLKCFFVIELKSGPFKPEWAGKLSFYLSAVDDLMRTTGDAPTIGLLLCKSHRSSIVEYTLRNIDKPIGVSSYRVTRELPPLIRNEVPAVEDLQEVVAKLRDEIEALQPENPRVP